MANHYVICDYGNEHYSPLSLSPYNLAEARRAINWQKQGGFDCAYHVCITHNTERGVFVSVDKGTQFKVNGAGWTPESWDVFIARIWGDENA